LAKEPRQRLSNADERHFAGSHDPLKEGVREVMVDAITVFVVPRASLAKFLQCAPLAVHDKKQCNADGRPAHAHSSANRVAQCGQAQGAVRVLRFYLVSTLQSYTLWSEIPWQYT
jgi:hypothetical protein